MGMNFSFDGMRRRIALDFNRLAITELNEDQVRAMVDLRNGLVGLLCIEGGDGEEDVHCLIDKYPLLEIKEDEDEEGD